MTARRLALFAAAALLALIAGVAVRPWLVQTPGPTDVAVAARNILAARFPDPEGREQPVAQWQGKVMVVNFWATWCPPCRQEIPAFVRAQRRYGNKVTFVGIAIDGPQQVKEFADEVQINYPLLIGNPDAMELARVAGNSSGGLPFTVILDRTGRIAATRLGTLSESRLEQVLADLTTR